MTFWSVINIEPSQFGWVQEKIIRLLHNIHNSVSKCYVKMQIHREDINGCKYVDRWWLILSSRSEPFIMFYTFTIFITNQKKAIWELDS